MKKIIPWVLGVLILPLLLHAKLINLSVRLEAQAGKPLITGFVINSSGRYLVRAVGPGLAQFNVQDTMVNPVLRVYHDQTYLGGNDDWVDGGAENTKTSSALQARVGAFALPNPSADAVCVIDLPAGAYTAHITDLGGGGGNVLVEVYEIPNE